LTTPPILELERQKQLLQLEYAAEKDAFSKQTEATGLHRKVKRGDAWYPLAIGKSYYNSLNRKVVEVSRTADTDIEHNFEFGRPVCFFRMENNDDGTKIHYASFTGTVSFAEGDRMAVIVPDDVDIIGLFAGSDIGIQLYFDETTYQLMFDALNRVMKAKDNRLAYLRDLFYSNKRAATFNFAPVSLPWLNSAQEKAVNEVLKAKDVMVVHGPPGTGKTTTLVEVVFETLKRENQVLVCAQSNMAVDWISEKLVDRGVSVLRIGNPKKVTDRMLSFTYERKFESHPDYPQLWSIRHAIRDLRSHKKGRGENLHQKLERLKDRATEIEIRINAQLFDEARAIVTTLAGSANRLLEGQKYGTLFIDEAAQALEAACWIPIRRVSRVVFAGDHCQLPPTVKSVEAMRGGLGKTLMERIVENKPEVVTLLKIQYRMNEQIMRFSSDWFYGGKVESAPQVRGRGILDFDIPMMWIDTSLLTDDESVLPKDHDADYYKEKFVGESFGRINKGEADVTLDNLQSYLLKIGKQRIIDEHIDVGIISPYRAQVQYIRHKVKAREGLKPFRNIITVNTVDGFQGQERDIIVISLVRSNDDGQIGFLSDLRRMNVAITRARMKLIIVGNARTMTKHTFYKKLYEYINNEINN
jgi:superfamily I DNA and/or RNA helicase